MSEDKKKQVTKRVIIGQNNYDDLVAMAETTDTPIADYLNYLMNRAIVEEVNRRKAKNPLYLWKS